MITALTIGGSDPTGGAGIQADLKTFKSFGVYGLSIPTALTAQNTNGVTEIFVLPPGFFSNQIDSLLKDVQPAALKTGMTGSGEMIRIVAEKIKQYSLKNLVIDPVTVSSTGVSLTDDKALETLRDSLFPLARVVTPNIYETSLLTGIQIQNEEDMKKAAVKLKELGPEAVIITGGHLEDNQTLDLLLNEGEFLSLQREKIDGTYHGTGCVFSSAFTACLALGYTVREATVRTNEFVWKAIKSAFPLGKGMKILDV